MAAAYPNRTSPVLRGSFILEYINGSPPPLPPKNVPPFPENDIGTAKARTVREIMAQHRQIRFAIPATASWIHWALRSKTSMPSAFGGTRIDMRARRSTRRRNCRTARHVNGPDELREALLRHPEQFVQSFIEGLLTYALGRTLDYRDMPSVRKIVHTAARDNYRFSSVVWQIVTSEPFLMRQAPEAPVATAQTASTQ